MHLGNKCSDNKIDTANLFAEYFSSVFTTPIIVDNNFLRDLNKIVDLLNCAISIVEVFQRFLNLSLDHIPGPDLVPPLFLYMC